jgi:hypothetical protein
MSIIRSEVWYQPKLNQFGIIHDDHTLFPVMEYHAVTGAGVDVLEMVIFLPSLKVHGWEYIGEFE